MIELERSASNKLNEKSSQLRSRPSVRIVSIPDEFFSQNDDISSIKIDTIKSDLLKSPELTGQWEHKLRLIEKGKYDPQTFKNELFKMVRELSDEVIFN